MIQGDLPFSFRNVQSFVILSLVTFHPSRLNRPILQQAGEIGHRGALAAADVKATGCDAGEEALVGRKAEQFPEAKTGIEMIAGASGDFGFGCERALDHEAAVGAACKRV